MNIPSNIIIYLFCVNWLFPVHAPYLPYVVYQPDNTPIDVLMHGHEYYNWIETIDGYVIEWVEERENKGWYYSILNNQGQFDASDILVSYPTPININIPKHLKEINPIRRALDGRCINYKHSNSYSRDEKISSIKPIIFLVDFNDESLPSSIASYQYSKEQFAYLLFEENINPSSGYLPLDYEMSVRDYFNEISNYYLSIDGSLESVKDWYTAEEDYGFYVDQEQGTGTGPNGIVQSAAALAIEASIYHDSTVDYSEYDGNQDGVLDVIILIVEGSANGDNSLFWPFRGTISSDLIIPVQHQNINGQFELDNTVIQDFILIPEKYWGPEGYGVSNGYIHPIGTICHELGHILGLPDLYDTSTNDVAGIGLWGLMGAGNWQKQISPAYLSAWSRSRLGYVDPIVKSKVYLEDIVLDPVEQNYNQTVIKLFLNKFNPKEYLLIENRQKIGADQYLKEEGLFVWHVDETITDIFPVHNIVNTNPDFYGVSLIQADGHYDLENVGGNDGDDGDPFPGSTSSRYLSENTYPPILYNIYDRNGDGNLDPFDILGVSINNIYLENQNITFNITNQNSSSYELGYDDGGWFGYSISPNNQLDRAGIRFRVDDESLLSAISTPVLSSYSDFGQVLSIQINIWEGWTDNSPENLIYSKNAPINWNSNGRDGGWVNISLLDGNIYCIPGLNYFAEIHFSGTGYLMPLDLAAYTNSHISDSSYYYSSQYDNYYTLSQAGIPGDWNIRLHLSNDNCLSSDGGDLWPGNTDANDVVNADDIIPIGYYWGYQGCYRDGNPFEWNLQSYASNWDEVCAAHADANGDGIVDISDVLVIMVNWDKETMDSSGESYIVNDECKIESLALSRDHFYDIYYSISGNSNAEVEIRKKLNEIFNFEAFPLDYVIKQNSPNPFNSQTNIPLELNKQMHVILNVYDLKGRFIENLINQQMEANLYNIYFDSKNLSSGLYLYQFILDGKIQKSNKMQMLK